MAKRISLLWLTTIGLLGLVLLSCGLILYVSLGLAQKNTSKLASDKASLIVTSVADQIISVLSPAEHQLAFIEDRIRQGQINFQSEQEIINSFKITLSGSQDIATLVYLNTEMHAIRVTQSQDGTLFSDSSDWRSEPFVNELINQVRPKWLSPLYVHGLDQTLITYSRPVFLDNSYEGVLLATVYIANLAEHFKHLSLRYDATPFILYDDDKVLVSGQTAVKSTTKSSTNKNYISWPTNLVTLEDSGDPVLRQIWNRDNAISVSKNLPSGFEARLVKMDNPDADYLFYYQMIDKFGDIPWIVGCYFSDASFATEFKLIEQAMYFCVFVLLLALLLALWFSRVLSRPVLSLANAAEKVYRHDLNEVPELKGSRITEFNLASQSFNHMVRGLKEKKKMQETFVKYVPRVMASEILAEGVVKPHTKLTTTLFTDIAGFSTMSEMMMPEQIIGFLNQYFAAMIIPIEKYNGVIHQFQGDAILATFNLPKDDERHAYHAVRAASEMLEISRAQSFGNTKSVRTRIGINTGEAVCGTIGGESRLGITVHGDEVNLAARIEQLNKKFDTQILVSASTYELTCAEFNYRYVGEVPVRGRKKSVKLYSL